MLSGFYFLISVVPVSLSVWMLRELDRAAKRRGESLVRAKLDKPRFRFLIVDFFSLIFLLQIPITALTQNPEGNSIINGLGIVWTFCLIAILLIWWTMIKTVSAAGIRTFRWRAMISMIVIPTSFIGWFFFPAGLIGLMNGENATLQMYVLVILTGIGFVVSPYLVKGAINSVELEELDSFDSVKSVDPFEELNAD